MSGTRMKQEPHLFEVEGVIPKQGETFHWMGTVQGGQNGCMTCDEPGEVVVAEVDVNDPVATYYISNETRDGCCGHTWVSPSDLRRGSSAWTGTTKLAMELREGVVDQSLTYQQITDQIYELSRVLVREFYSTTQEAAGVCSACFTDVRFVGGTWEHEDKRTCSPPAVLLS